MGTHTESALSGPCNVTVKTVRTYAESHNTSQNYSTHALFVFVVLGGISPTCRKLIEKKVGDTVEITPLSPGITSAYWKYGVKDTDEGVKIVDDFNNKPLKSQFEGRVVMKNTTFNLIISELTLQDSGILWFVSSENNVQRKTICFDLRVYGKV